MVGKLTDCQTQTKTSTNSLKTDHSEKDHSQLM